MQDQINGRGQQVEVRPDGGAATALDAIAIMRFAERLGNRETDAGTGGFGTPSVGTSRQEVAELTGRLAAGERVRGLVIGMFAEAVRLGHGD